MLPKRFYTGIGRPPGTYLSSLPGEIREELFRYSTRCSYQITLNEERFKTSGMVDLRISGSGIDVPVSFDTYHMARKKQGVNRFIEGVFRILHLGAPATEASPIFYPELEIGYKESLGFFQGKISTRGANIEICTELIEALLRIDQLVKSVVVPKRIKEY